MEANAAHDALDEALRGVHALDDREAVVAFQTAQNALEALKAQRLAAMEETRSYELDGASSLATWSRSRLRLAATETKQLVAAARTAKELPEVGQAASSGRIGLKHTGLFSYGLKHIGHEVMTESVPWLLDVATSSEPKDLRTVVRSLREAIYPDSLDEAWMRGMDKQDFQITPVPDGWHVQGFLNHVTGAKFNTVHSALGAPKDAADVRTGAQRRVDALDELLDRILENGLPSDKGIRPQIMVLTPLEAALEAERKVTDRFTPTRLGPPATLVGFGAIGPKLLGYLSCTADVTGILTRDEDAPVADVLNVGRRHRLATGKQRQAIIARQHGECAAPACKNTHLEVHHATWWSRGGRTDLDELIGLCPRCHALVHRELLHIRARGSGHFDVTGSDTRMPHAEYRQRVAAHRETARIRRISRHIQHRRDQHRHTIMRT